MTNSIQPSTHAPTIQRMKIARVLSEILKRFSPLSSTARKQTRESFHHTPKHIRMDIALDELERARLLRGGLR